MWQKFCFGCHKTKTLNEFSLKTSGRVSEYCKDCEEKFSAPKVQAKGYPSDKPGLLAGLDHGPINTASPKPERPKKKVVPRQRVRVKKLREVPKQNYKGYTDEQYMLETVKPFIIEIGDGFNSTEFRRYWRRSKGWFYKLMGRLENAGFIAVNRGVSNRGNTYYLTDKGYKVLGLNRDDTGVYLQFVDL